MVVEVVVECFEDQKALIPYKQINPKSILHSLEKKDINTVQGGHGYTSNNPITQY